MKIAIVDDEQKWRDLITEVVKKYTYESDEIEEFDSGVAFLKKNRKYDIVLMDIEMPEMDGFDTVMNYKIEYPESKIVILTIHLECARKGYLVDAFRYVDKTKMDEELGEAFEKIREIKSEKSFFVTIREEEFIKKISTKDILYIETRGKGSKVYTVDKCYISSEKLGELEPKLEECGFFRCHKSFLINLSAVDYMDKDSAFFSNNRKACISARKYVETKRKYIAAKKKYASM